MLQQDQNDAKIRHLLEHNAAVVQAVRDSHIGLRLVPMDIYHENFTVVAISDSSFMNCGKDKTDSQAAYVIGVGIDSPKQGLIQPFNPHLARTHKIKRKVRSTLGAEAMAQSEGSNAGELVRVIYAEIRAGLRLPLRDHQERDRVLGGVRLLRVTDCRSLYDCATGVGKRPAEARLLLDIDALKEFENAPIKWTCTQQMLADPLTKVGALQAMKTAFMPNTCVHFYGIPQNDLPILSTVLTSTVITLLTN